MCAKDTRLFGVVSFLSVVNFLVFFIVFLSVSEIQANLCDKAHYYLVKGPGYYEKALELCPGFIRAHELIGNDYLEKKILEKAAHHFQKAVDLGSKNSKLYSLYASLQFDKGDFQEARKLANISKDLDPNNAMAQKIQEEILEKLEKIKPTIVQQQVIVQEPKKVQQSENKTATAKTPVSAISNDVSQSSVLLQSKPAKGLALIIGNSDYPVSPLKNPKNDARDIAHLLTSYGFEVIHKENANRRQILKALSSFGKKLYSADVGLFYFAGHGMQIEGINYLIPVNSQIEAEEDVEFEAVKASRILAKMSKAENGTNIVILDACRNNPFASSFRSDTKGLAKMDAPLGSIIAYSTAPNSVAADGAGRNSIYTKHLLKHMRTSQNNISDIFMMTRNDVVEETDEKQIPWETTSMRGHFYFNLQAPAKIGHPQ